MRKLIYILHIIFTFLSGSVLAQVDAADNDLIVQGEKFYETKNYKKAIEAYEKLIVKGYTSAKLYYNLGLSLIHI